MLSPIGGLAYALDFFFFECKPWYVVNEYHCVKNEHNLGNVVDEVEQMAGEFKNGYLDGDVNPRVPRSHF